MKKEHALVFIIGLFILSYVLDAAVNPLPLDLATPYDYLKTGNFTQYPFTTASVMVKALGIFLTPILMFSLVEKHYMAKAVILLVMIGFMQLYSLQDIATGASVVPLEWALSISIAGIALALPMLWYFMLGILSWLHISMGGKEEVPVEIKAAQPKKKKGSQDGDYLNK